jgi:hypothetical protein
MTVREEEPGGGAMPLAWQVAPEAAGDQRLAGADALLPEIVHALRTLREGGCACLPVRGSFPEQFICVGTADQIRRLVEGLVV